MASTSGKDDDLNKIMASLEEELVGLSDDDLDDTELNLEDLSDVSENED